LLTEKQSEVVRLQPEVTESMLPSNVRQFSSTLSWSKIQTYLWSYKTKDEDVGDHSNEFAFLV
jgi:hypothetical protein